MNVSPRKLWYELHEGDLVIGLFERPSLVISVDEMMPNNSFNVSFWFENSCRRRNFHRLETIPRRVELIRFADYNG